MRQIEVNLLFAMVMIWMAACSPGTVVEPIRGAGEIVAEVDALPGRGGTRCMKELTEEKRSGDGFDVNRYYDIFDHLSMQPGYALDYEYLDDGLGCKSVVYARRMDEEPLSGYLDYLSWKDILHPGSLAVIEGSDDYLEHVDVDDTPEGYFQFVALSIVEDQFYLY